jgi:hypothetical protein
MPMKFWRRSVKNRFTLNSMRLLVVALAVFSLAFQSDCQKADLAPLVKYNTDAEVPRITLEDAKKEYDKGTAVIVDSRGEAAYKQEHIKGALNIPLGAPESQFSTIPKGKKIIVYCS